MGSTSGMMAEEQQEQLRRFVDEWRERVSSKNKGFQGENLEAVFNDSSNAIGNIISNPLHINPLEPADRTPLLHLVHTNNVLFNKLITVLSYDCIEITRLHKQECRDRSKEYPVVREEKLSKEIKKLGAAEDGMSFLDQFRQLISEMGNALGFVRMVRMGGLQHSSTASGFVQGQTTFEERARLLNMNAEAVKAGVLLDRTLERQGMPVEQMNYFRILIEVFSEELQSANNLHLKEFYLILPALIMNAVETMLQSKDKLLKKGRESLNALFTDDGLVLGLAYILKVLNQDKQFDSLHWFESATRHFSNERKRLQDGLNMDTIESGLNGLQVWSQKFASLSEEEVQNMQLVIKRTESFLTEIELMEYNFTASRILF